MKRENDSDLQVLFKKQRSVTNIDDMEREILLSNP